MSIAAPVIPVLRGECLELAGQIVKVQGDSTSKNTGAGSAGKSAPHTHLEERSSNSCELPSVGQQHDTHNQDNIELHPWDP